MLDLQSEIRHYDSVYGRHTDGAHCPVSVANLEKARKRLNQVCASFGINFKGTRVLDLGCGLGYIAEAMRLEGANVVAIDASAVAIQRASAKFPRIDFRHVLFPEGLSTTEKFDFVWLLDIWPLNTFHVQEMKRNVLDSAARHLKPNGTLIMGWHSNFSGDDSRNWSHWTFQTVEDVQHVLGFSGPRVPQARWRSLSWLTMRACKVAGKSCPIFFVRTGRRLAEL
jgi:2-polyprenyl-3-methyl-5-hydroxy-6-metoxy-1,4-benzoquinol methylase